MYLCRHKNREFRAPRGSNPYSSLLYDIFPRNPGLESKENRKKEDEEREKRNKYKHWDIKVTQKNAIVIDKISWKRRKQF